MRQFASFNYLGELPPLLDGALLLLVIAVFCARPGWIAVVAPRIEHALGRMPKSLATRCFLFFALGSGLHLLTLAVLGPPVPWVSDEQAYLLGAETFASGRLTNPAPVISEELDLHLAQDHVLSAPTRQSKYPPGQSLVLAGGAAAGSHPLALTLLAGGLATAMLWCLTPVLSPALANLGALTFLLWVGIGSYWNQSYWGGSLGAIGGSLVLGGALRLSEHDSRSKPGWLPSGAVPLGLGATLLAITRPYEGFAYVLPFIVAMALTAVRRTPSRRASIRALLAVALIVSGGLLWLAFYNRAVTGDPLTLPHNLYTKEGALGEQHFHWTASGDSSWLVTLPQLLIVRANTALWFLLGLPLALALGSWWLSGLAKLSTHRPARLPRASWWALATVLVAQALAVPYFPHYTSPASAGLLLVSLVGLEQLRHVRFLGRTWFEPLLVSAVICAVFGAAIRLPAHRPDPGSEIVFRAQTIADLEAEGGSHLILVDPGGQSNGYWVHNSANPLAQPVLWARSLGPKRDQALISELKRTAWRIEFSQGTQRLLRLNQSGFPYSAPP